MARHDQKKLFLLACLQDSPLVQLLPEHKIPLAAWPYLNAIRKQREKLEKIVHASIKDLEKQKRGAINKATMFFQAIVPANKQNQETTPDYYLSFLCGLCNDIWWETKKKQEKLILEKIESHLYQIFARIQKKTADLDINNAVQDLKTLQNYF